MGEMDDPAYIKSLLDPNSNYSCYFSIGDPLQGPVERIGVVPPMLMAHSLVLRRALDVQKSEVKEKWDVPVSDITSKTFKDVLRYAYGYNNIKNQSLPHSVELLALADRWVMKPMSQDLTNHIVTIMNPINICLAMRDPICFRVKRVEEEISRLLKANAMRVLTSPYLHLVCPTAMRYIVLLKNMRASDLDVWRAVMRWAWIRALNQSVTMNTVHMDLYHHPRLVVPCRKYIRLCSLNMIDLVEEVLANHPNKQINIEGMYKYHFIPVKPPRSLYVCTESTNVHHLKHEEFEVKMVRNCDSWMMPVYLLSSTLTVTNNTDHLVELYSILCSSKQRLTHKLVQDHELADPTNQPIVTTDFNYEISCEVRVFWVSSGDDIKETEIVEVHFETDAIYGHDFQILLSTKTERLLLRPNSSYLIEMEFSQPHPLWYMNETDSTSPGLSSDVDVGCGLISKEGDVHGSHVKCVLYRTLPQG